MNDTTQTLIRAGLKIGGSVLATHGIMDEATAETATGIVAAILGLILGIFKARKGKGASVSVSKSF